MIMLFPIEFNNRFGSDNLVVLLLQGKLSEEGGGNDNFISFTNRHVVLKGFSV